MSNQNVTQLMKKQMIESQCVNGKCYLRLLAMLPNFGSTTQQNLEDTIVQMARTLGSKPFGVDIPAELWIANMRLSGAEPNPYQGDLHGSEFVADLMSSNCRFGWEEIGGVIHVSHYLEDDACEEIFCNHGWSARFVLCMLIRPGVKVGAEVDLSALFMDVVNHDEVEEEEAKPARLFERRDSVQDELRSRVDDQWNEIERLNEQIRKIRASPNMNRSKGVANSRLTREIEKLMETHVEEDVEETILPVDSSSQYGRYNKKFLNAGTIYNVNNRGQTVLAVESTRGSNNVGREIVQGFVKTEEMFSKEQKVLQRVMPINGLANPFKSNRLNLLCHFHTAVSNIQLRSSKRTHYEAICFLTKYKSLTPSEELAHQMVINTFDLQSNTVIANPYNFPFLEIGMGISDDSLAKSFDLLRLEYKMLWFEQLKSLEIPDFHSSYRKFTDRKTTHYSTDLSNNSSTLSKTTPKLKIKNKSGSSILSIMK